MDNALDFNRLFNLQEVHIFRTITRVLQELNLNLKEIKNKFSDMTNKEENIKLKILNVAETAHIFINWNNYSEKYDLKI